MACGALRSSEAPDGDAPSWGRPTRGERLLFPVHALSRVSRSKLLAAPQRVLPGGFKRIRHHGPLAPCAKAERLAQARRLQAMAAANRQAREDARAFMKRVSGIDLPTLPGEMVWWSSAGRMRWLCGTYCRRARLVAECRHDGAGQRHQRRATRASPCRRGSGCADAKGRRLRVFCGVTADRKRPADAGSLSGRGESAELTRPRW